MAQQQLQKISETGCIWLAADMHLGPHAPATLAAFLSFLESAAQQANALLLCGDIFEVWVGDDTALQNPEPWLQTTVNALQALAQQIPLWIGRGNRDFLMGQAFAQHLGAKLLDETLLLPTPWGRLLISHGDEYCTDDVAYQRFKRWVRNPLLQSTFLALPQTWRQKVALLARQKSQASYAKKGAHITDVNRQAVANTFSQHEARALLHGHTHRPGLHYYYTLDSKPRTRLVLPDWNYDTQPHKGGWAVINRHGIELHYWCGVKH